MTSIRQSDRQIAKTVKASPTTVGTVRCKMEATGDVSKLDTRKDTKGRKQPTRKPKKAIEADSDIDNEIEPEEVVDVLDLLEEVLDGEPLTAKQAATFEKIKKRLKRRAREDAKREIDAIEEALEQQQGAPISADTPAAETDRQQCGISVSAGLDIPPSLRRSPNGNGS